MRDISERILYALLRPAARVAMRAEVAVRDVKKLAELAYYHEARREGLKMREMSEVLDISMSKVGALSKQLKEHFREPETEHGMDRQILALLWAMPLTATRIAQALPEFDEDEITDRLAKMVEGGNLESIPGRTERFKLTGKAYRLDIDPVMAKLDGLNTLLHHVDRAIETRLVRGDARAMVRNLYFNAREEDLERLQKFYEEQLFPLICELDEAAQEQEDVLPVRLSILWAPDDLEEEEVQDDEDDS